MILLRKATDLRNYLLKTRLDGHSIGFVPTMGALHEGHLQLVKAAKEATDFLVTSIFINPTQFNDAADFRNYPVTIEADIRLLESAGVDILFYPSVAELYPTGTNELEHYELGQLEELLEGSSRPGHFQGVCQVMNRLLQAVQPNHLFMGQKDYQQCMVVKELIRQENFHIQFHAIPTVREGSGLAMSSRNRRLSPTESEAAAAIYQSMRAIETNLQAGSTAASIEQAKQDLEKAGFRVDYVSIADVNTLDPVEVWDGHQKIVILVAAFIGPVRLIDNLLVTR